MESCKKYQELISAAIDGEISEADRSALVLHLESCPRCRKVAEVLAAVSKNISRETPAPPELAAGTMAKIRATADQPTGFRKFISGYGKYTGIAAAVVVLILGINVFTNGPGNMAAPKKGSDACAPMAAADAPAEAAEAETMYSSVYKTADEDQALTVTGSAAGGALDCAAPESVEEEGLLRDNAPLPEPSAAPEAPAAAPDGNDGGNVSFSGSSMEVTDVNALYAEKGYTERFYSVSRLLAPAPEALAELLVSSETDMLYSDYYEHHYKVPMARLNELDPEVFTEIVFDDLTAEHGLIILMTPPEETEEN